MYISIHLQPLTSSTRSMLRYNLSSFQSFPGAPKGRRCEELIFSSQKKDTIFFIGENTIVPFKLYIPTNSKGQWIDPMLSEEIAEISSSFVWSKAPESQKTSLSIYDRTSMWSKCSSARRSIWTYFRSQPRKGNKFDLLTRISAAHNPFSRASKQTLLTFSGTACSMPNRRDRIL